MKKIKIIAAIAALITTFSSMCANAQDMNMYVNDHFMVRDVQTVAGFDMLPILDIAGELGFNCSFDGTTITLYNDSKSYVFTVGSASVYDESGNWYGLDVVPHVINGKIRVPAKFFQDAMGMSYVWDAVTNTVFMGSEDTYNWLINTEEYKHANKKYMSRLYYQVLQNTGTLIAYSGDTVGNRRMAYNCNNLWYYVADVNTDGILDLIVSAENYLSNGIMIYTYSNGQIVQTFTSGFPYSSGVTILTLAEYNNKYGIFRHTQNSADDFSLSYIYSDWTVGTDTYGWHYDKWIINGGNVGKSVWESKFDSIKPVWFYNIWGLKSMGE